MNYAVMPMADYKAACDKLREKTKTTELIKSGELPQKIDEVYQEGQLSVFLSSKVLQGKTEGNPISITDVSPVEHDLSVKLSGDTLTDFSSVKVAACGKNLFDKDEITRKFSVGDYETSDDTNSYSVVSVQLKPNAKYCVKINGSQNGSQTFINSRKKVNTTSGISISANWAATEKVFTTDETGKLYVGTYGATNREKIGNVLNIALVQVEEGTIATGYEPYKAQIYTANADGTVLGVKSIYPVMNLSSDTPVVISAEYFKDIDKVLGEGAS